MHDRAADQPEPGPDRLTGIATRQHPSLAAREFVATEGDRCCPHDEGLPVMRRATEPAETSEGSTAPCGDTPEDVLARYWTDHHGELVRYASYLLGGDTHAAEDVAQETAIRLWRNAGVLVDGRSATGWLRTVARNIVIDRARRRRARPAEVALAPGVDREIRDEFDTVDATDSVTRILSGLAPLYRAVVLQVYVRDRPVADVAAELGIPVGTVKSRCHTAVRQLRAAVPRQCPA
jgi:RNA polymerase sigma-70 factor, ECF subfamily